MWFDRATGRPVAGLVAGSLALAACSSPVTITTTEPASLPTSATATTGPAAATTTEPSTTTTEPPAADTLVTVGNTCLLGWWDEGWQTGDDLPVDGGEEYQVVRLDEPITLTTGSEARTHCEPLDLVSVEFDPIIPGSFLEIDALAIQTQGEVRPSPVELLGLSIPATRVSSNSEVAAT